MRAERLFRLEHPAARRDWLVLPSLHTEAMGDISAVEFAQEAHAHVLYAAGVWRPGHRITGLDLLPRSRTLEMLTVDDHVGLAIVGADSSPRSAPEALAMEEVFRRSLAAYDATPGLSEHPGKRLSAAGQAIVLGAEFDGEADLVGAPRSKRLVLAWISAAVGGGGALRRAIIRQLAGQWTYAGCFVRSSMSLFENVYSLLEAGDNDDSMVEVEPKVAAGLLAMACVAHQLV